jgi:hypothetical protein
MGTPIMSAVLTAVVLASAAPHAEAVLAGVTTAVWVNGGLCVAAALAVAAFLREPRTNG